MRRLLLSNAAVRAVTTPLAMLAALVGSWLSVGYLGAQTYAAVLLITGLAQLLPFADMGVGAAVINSLSSDASARTRHRTLVSAQRVLLGAAGVIVLVAGALAVLNLWPSILGEGADPISDPDQAAFAFFAAFAVFIFVQLGYRMLTGLGWNQLTSALSGAGSLLSLLFVGLGVALGATPVWFVLAPTVASTLMATVAGVIAGRRSGHRYLDLLRDVPRLRSVPQVAIAGTALPMVIILIALPALLFSHRLILSHVSTVDELAEYTLASQVYAPAWAAVSGTLMALWPHFAATRSSDPTASRRSLRTSTAVIGVAGVLGGLALCLVIPWGTAVIGHGQATASWWVAAGFGLLLLAQTAFYPLGMYLTRPGELRFQAACVAAMLAVGLPASVFAASRWGAPGPLWVSAIAIVCFQALPALVFLSSSAKNDRVAP